MSLKDNKKRHQDRVRWMDNARYFLMAILAIIASRFIFFRFKYTKYLEPINYSDFTNPPDERPETAKTNQRHLDDEKKKNALMSSRIAHAFEHSKDDTNDDSSNNKTKMNILLLYADDWRYDTLGAAGHKIVKTPFFDYLAKKGMLFSHNCVTTSICWISRASLYTGQYMSRHGTRMPKDVDFLQYWNETFPSLLRDNGYHTGLIGKWHLNEFPKGGFDYDNMYYGFHIMNTPSGKMHVTKKNELDSIEFLKNRPKDKPFCLTVSFFATHAEDGNPKQYTPQLESMRRYENITVPIAPTHNDESWKRLPYFFTESNEARSRYRWRHDTPKKHQTMMKNFYRMVTEVDSASYKITRELKNQGVLKNTLVIFTTDNGLFQGEHGLADKWYPHEESIRVPLIIMDPRMPNDRKGTVNDDFTLNVDLAPTILSAAGIQPPERMQGRDMSELYLKDATSLSPPWRKEFFYEHPVHSHKSFIPASEALVRKGFKLMVWPDFNYTQLFKMDEDPHEEMDLAKFPQYKDIYDEMMKRFLELKASAL